MSSRHSDFHASSQKSLRSIYPRSRSKNTGPYISCIFIILQSSNPSIQTLGIFILRFAACFLPSFIELEARLGWSRKCAPYQKEGDKNERNIIQAFFYFSLHTFSSLHPHQFTPLISISLSILSSTISGVVSIKQFRYGDGK